ncbi:MAG: hypothetical protein SFV20_01575 [Sphingopyxis sp.]|nr:hypothetical protein [Sphingopyxis sp.]
MAATAMAAEPPAADYAIALDLRPAASRWSAVVRASNVPCEGPIARLHLHRDIRITAAFVDGRRVTPVFDPPDAPRFWINAARSFDLPCPRKSLVLRYDGPGQLHADGRNQISPTLVELSLYGAWYPLAKIDDKIRWRLTTRLPRGWRFATPARVKARSGTLTLHSDAPTDIVLIASPLFDEEQVVANGTTVRLLVNRTLPTEARATALARARAAADMTAWAGAKLGKPVTGASLLPTIVFTPRGGSLSYSRLPLIILREAELRGDSGDRPPLVNVRHEIAHFWSRAPQAADWLNEGVAEYLALHRTGDVDGTAVMDAVLADYRRQIAAAGPEAPITAGPDERTFRNTYARPALLFDALARRHGTAAVAQLLAALFALGSEQSVDNLLARVDARFGADERATVARCLASRDWSPSCGG